jgi:molybdopterin-synthase adenylyltransferase
MELLKAITSDLMNQSETVTNPEGNPVKIIKDEILLALADKYSKSAYFMYEQAMVDGICPYRYLRNRNTISLENQLTLARAKIAIIGAGGLGGQSIILLARMGVGNLTVVDYDQFDETNLNRQALSSMAAVGEYKALEAQKVVATINPAIQVNPEVQKIGEDNIEMLLTGKDIVIDALDNIPDRLTLEQAASKVGIPMIHGALAGFDGQVSLIQPGRGKLKNLFGDHSVKENAPPGAEKILGVPAVTATMIASFQTMECIKILLNRGPSDEDQFLHLNLEYTQLNKFKL